VTTENQFYRRHYGGGVEVGATPLDVFEREMLASGKRYGLVVECLSKDQPIGGCIAEIGCGGAEALLIISRRYRFDRVVGIDIAANVRSEGVPPGFEILDCNLNEKWPFKDAEVDYLIAMMIIEHLFDPFHAFQEIKRCVSKNGSAYVNLPLVTGIRNRIRLLFGYVPETSVSYKNWFNNGEWDGNHLHYFSMSSIRDLAHSCGLRLTDVSGVGKLHKLKTRLPQLLASEVTFRLQHET
jgi:SAM-dependent methyltransferase